MRLSFTHPNLEELSRFLESRDGRQRRRLQQHLARCGRCRASLAFLRRLGQAVREAPPVGPSADLLERIDSDRRIGARVILPTGDPPAARRRIAVRAVAVGAVVVMVAGALLARLPSASADATGGDLTFRPGAPTRGATIRVRYRPGILLAGHSRLALRMRYRTPSDESYDRGIPTRTAVSLERRGEAEFAGTFVLPDSAVYAAFAVEDGSATVLDDNRGRFWELLVHGSDGKPLFEALEQRAHDMMGRNWEEGFATARRMVDLYPDDLRAWLWLRVHHGWLGWMDVDSIRALHVARLRAFDRDLGAQHSVAGDDLGLMYWYARGVKDSTAATRWRERLLRGAPRNSFAVQERLGDILGRLGQSHDTSRALAALDTLWAEAPDEDQRAQQVSGYAYQIAKRRGDPDLIRRWADRSSERSATLLARHSVARRYAADFAGIPGLRTDGMARLRAELSWLAAPPPEDRRLGETVERQRERHERTRRTVYAALGRALIASGDTRAGLDTLALATATGWDLELFRTTGAARLEAGDTAGALEMYARVAVDPRTSPDLADSLGRLAGAAGGRIWEDRLATGRAEFPHRMLARGISRPLPSAVRVTDADGARHELEALIGGGIAVVVFWSRFCAPALDALPHVDSLAARLAQRAVKIVSIVEERPSDELAAFVRDKGLSLPVYHDVRGEANRAFNNWGTPQYYVLDARGRIRFDYADSVNEILAQVEAVRLEAELGGAR